MSDTVTETVGEGSTLPVAQRVFGIAELFDIILASLRPSDIIRCCRVSKVFYHGVKTSPDLQARLCLSTVVLAGAPRYFPLAPHCITMRTFHQHFPTCPHIAGSIDCFSVQRILGTGALWEEMYITNPPIKTMELSCGVDNSQIMRRKAGIKFKDLVQEMCVMAKSCQKSHKNASASDESNMIIVFAGPVDEKRYRKYQATKPLVNIRLFPRGATPTHLKTETPSCWIYSQWTNAKNQRLKVQAQALQRVLSGVNSCGF
ncbi:hypothetical protein LTR56_012571 [Elasticomyces elasticus]|nr:hypothetical protein LTR22_022882 [Elasticomyces elasticus]KAK3639211.1 hypothetical protein LTR56_012571 [Elasticomyces elasticus]KAK4924904.1 hypothetical protein LTR49_008125 [Elasticomyces elasticus]KAK5746768.1 hypothetical protein LTS12_022618 [Elasticomyces elasticus]